MYMQYLSCLIIKNVFVWDNYHMRKKPYWYISTGSVIIELWYCTHSMDISCFLRVSLFFHINASEIFFRVKSPWIEEKDCSSSFFVKKSFFHPNKKKCLYMCIFCVFYFCTVNYYCDFVCLFEKSSETCSIVYNCSILSRNRWLFSFK